MDNENNWKPFWDDKDIQEFEDTIAIYNDLTCANMNLILKVQEHLKRNTQLASMMILSIGMEKQFLVTFTTY